MGEFYKPYPEEFYAVNRILPINVSKQFPILLFTIDFTNRCVKYNAIHQDRKRFDSKNIKVLYDELNKNELIPAYLNKFFPSQSTFYKGIIANFTSSEPSELDSLLKESSIDLHYHMVKLYHSFPNNPDKYLDGILMKVETQLAMRDEKRIMFATIDVLEKKESDASKFPWARFRFFNKKKDPIEINTDDSSTTIKIEASQDDLTIFAKSSNRIEKNKNFQFKKVTGNKDPSMFFYQHLYLWFLQRFKFPKHFIAIPIYSADFPEGDFGYVIGHFYLPFQTARERDKFWQQSTKFKKLKDLWKIWTTLTLRTLLNGRSHLVTEHEMRFNDGLKSLLDNISLVQNWERIMVFNKPRGELEYCFTRFKGGKKSDQRKPQPYEEVWDVCNKKEKKKPCNECPPKFIKSKLSQIIRNGGAAEVLTDKETNSGCFYFRKLGDLLDPRILPSVQEADIAQYENCILCFEFPQYTFFPMELCRGNKANAIQKLGDHYINKLIPVFDRLLLRRKVLKHSIKSAVAAIMSRNMSHNIGSHILARIQLEEMVSTIKRALNGVTDGKVTDVCNLILEEFHQYLQKKSDFLAEVSTEPYIAPRSALLYRDVILPLTEKIVLMDYIARNDGIRYEQLSIRFFSKIRASGGICEIKPEYYKGQECGKDCNYPHKMPYAKVCPQCVKYYQVDKARYYVYRVQNSNYDVMVDLPGSVGEFAIYNILEAIIRNAAKHNSSKIGQNTILEIAIKVEEDVDPMLYICTVWDNLSDGNLKDKMNGYIKETIVDQRTGNLKPQNWGIAEMKICATLLQDRSFDEMESDPKRFLKAVKVDGNRLGYRFRILRARRALLVGETKWDKLCEGGSGEQD